MRFVCLLCNRIGTVHSCSTTETKGQHETKGKHDFGCYTNTVYVVVIYNIYVVDIQHAHTIYWESKGGSMLTTRSRDASAA